MDIKIIYVNSDGLNQEHDEAVDSIKMASFKTATKELTDAKLAKLIDGADAADEHIHDNRYFRENEHVSISSGVADAGKPVILGASGTLDPSLVGGLNYANRNLDNLTEPTAIPAGVRLNSLATSQTFGSEYEFKTADQTTTFSGSVRMRAGDVAGNFVSGGARVLSGFNTSASRATPTSTATGPATVQTGNITGGTQGSTGVANLLSGAITVSGVTGNTGAARVISGNNAGVGETGFVVMTSGLSTNAAGGKSGDVFAYSGKSQNGPSGNVIINTGAVNTDTIFGTSFNNVTGTGATGSIDMRSGEIANASSTQNTGAMTLSTGNNAGAGASGDMILSTGTAASGARGQVQINSGLFDVNSFSVAIEAESTAYLQGAGSTGIYSSASTAYVAAFSTVVIETDSQPINTNSSDVVLRTGAVSGAGVRGKINVEASHIDMNSVQIKNLADPILGTDAVNLQTLQAYQEGLKPKAAVRAATTANVDLSTGPLAGSVLDGVTLVDGDRILVKDQTIPLQNGIYVVDTSALPARATDFDSVTPIDEINGAYVFVSEGSQAGKAYVVTAPVVTSIDTSPINWVFFNSAAALSGGNGIDITSNVISVDISATSQLRFVAGELEVDVAGMAGEGLGEFGNQIIVNWASNFTIDAADNLAVKAADLANTSAGKGASIIGVQDAAGYFAANNQEGVNAELYQAIQNAGVSYTVGAGGVTKGDLVFIDADNTVLPLATLTANERCIGLALETVAAAGSVKVLADDTVLAGVLSAATPGTPYYWNGTGFSATIPTGTGANVWLVGVAKNATDLHVEVQQIKKNS